jgi:hypothetical protein
MIPVEFTSEAIESASQDAFLPYRDFLRSGEPYASIASHNPWTKVPSARSELEWGKGWYYDTTVARKHPDWRDLPLPRPTRDMEQLRRDLYAWGFCLVADALSADQCARIRERVVEQAAAERDLGAAYLSPAQQHVWSLINKGEQPAVSRPPPARFAAHLPLEEELGANCSRSGGAPGKAR